MEQTKALNALEPFVLLSKSATSPRAAADLVTRATSAPNTFLFAELLSTPAIQALAESPDHAPYLTLIQIFSYGTYATYQQTPDLPALSDKQIQKLRQLTLLTLARDRESLTYSTLQSALGLENARQLEDLVISAIYAGLLHATLDPARSAVNVSSVAPLRDLAPNSIPSFISALKTWTARCTTTLTDLDAEINNIRAAATQRNRERRVADTKLKQLVADSRDREAGSVKYDLAARDNMQRRGFGKRAVGGGGLDDELMDLDGPFGLDEEKKRASKRKM